ncbi:hypothetical protein FRC01_000640 [Tulasnella sp. 417]|nr:hypothetical protein FRC01_000640 [Tulasnella sp. 417]
MSPELSLGVVSKHSLESDVWAWGCTAFEVMTGIIPYSEKPTNAAVMVEICIGSVPGLVSALDSLITDPSVDLARQAGVTSLQSIISQCWEFEPTGRPSTSSVWILIAVPSQGEGNLGAWKDQEVGISSLRSGDDSGNQEDKTAGKRKHRADHNVQKSGQGGRRKGQQAPNDVAASSSAHPEDETVGKQMAEAAPEPQKADRGGKKKDPWKAPNGVAETGYPRVSSPAHPKGLFKLSLDGIIPTNSQARQLESRPWTGLKWSVKATGLTKGTSPEPTATVPRRKMQGDRSSPSPIDSTNKTSLSKSHPRVSGGKPQVAASDGPSQEDTWRPQFPEPNREHRQEVPQQIPPNIFKAPVAASDSPSQEDTPQFPEPNRQHKQEVPQQVPPKSFREKAPVVASEAPSQEVTRRPQFPEPYQQHKQEVPQQVPLNSLRGKAPVAVSDGPSLEDTR